MKMLSEEWNYSDCNQCWAVLTFCENRRFWFWGQLLRTTSVLNFFFPILRTASVFRIKKKQSGKAFFRDGSHKSVLTNYDFLLYIYKYIFFCVSFLTISVFLWHETQFRSKFGAKLSLPYPFFSWTLSTNHCCCYVYCSCKWSRAWCI